MSTCQHARLAGSLAGLQIWKKSKSGTYIYMYWYTGGRGFIKTNTPIFPAFWRMRMVPSGMIAGEPRPNECQPHQLRIKKPGLVS